MRAARRRMTRTPWPESLAERLLGPLPPSEAGGKWIGATGAETMGAVTAPAHGPTPSTIAPVARWSPSPTLRSGEESSGHDERHQQAIVALGADGLEGGGFDSGF